MSIQKPLTACLLLLLMVLVAASPAGAAPAAQTDEVYVVQAGDTLFAIALRFGVTAADLAAANNLSNPNLIFVGQKLVIPGAKPTAEPAIVTERNEGADAEAPPAPPQVYVVQPGDTLFAIATRFGLSLTDIVLANGIQDPDYIAVGQRLVIPTPGASKTPVKYPEPFAGVELSADPVLQGQTLVVRVALSQPATLSGDFDGRPIFFVGDAKGGWALVGIHALQDVGVYSLALRAKLQDGKESVTAVDVVVGAGPYATEDIQLAPGRESLLDPQLVQAEQARMIELWSQFSPRPLWEGPFGLPLAESRITSPFGTRRSYNEGPVNGFHAGTDFGAGGGTPIYAPAAGRVILADQLIVRGNAVLVDHGMGVFSGYWHQSALAVHAGQTVQRGDLIGYVGDTGLVTGAHLHWEMRVGGIAVDPMQWTQTAIP
jgi:murein DD-endopeptidase MepM/ murein hydrolase activator NlpD